MRKTERREKALQLIITSIVWPVWPALTLFEAFNVRKTRCSGSLEVLQSKLYYIRPSLRARGKGQEAKAGGRRQD